MKIKTLIIFKKLKVLVRESKDAAKKNEVEKLASHLP